MKQKLILLFILISSLTLIGCEKKAESPVEETSTEVKENTPEEKTPQYSIENAPFVEINDVAPDILKEVRYYADYNFVGKRIDGYEEPIIILTKEAAYALKNINEELKEKGYRLKIYDGYRPQRAVENFIRWAEDEEDQKMKAVFYPELDKSLLFDEGYISAKSGHSKGSTVDLTLVDNETGDEVDMGGTFDYFGERSHPDYTDDLTEEQLNNRMILRETMLSNGFKPIDTEWWHFQLSDEPYPDTYFDFPISYHSLVELANQSTDDNS